MHKVSMLDVARSVGVSKNTVSLAFRNDPQISPATRQKIQEAADQLGYRKNPVVSHLMAQLRVGSTLGYKHTLALLNANEDQQAFTTHPTIPTYVEGCRRQAELLGYNLDEFWLHDPRVGGEKLAKILRARGIRGVIIVGLMNVHSLPPKHAPIWDNFPCVVTGTRTSSPALSFACTDHHMVALRACENALRIGYRRPALVVERSIDELVDRRFTAGMVIAQQQLPLMQRLEPFYQVVEAQKKRAIFRDWFEQQRPDVILSLFHDVKHWLKGMMLEVPRDVGLIQLEWRKDHAEWAGINQHNEVVGEAAVEMVVGMIHHGESGVPPFPRATLIGGTWIQGETVRKTVPAASA